MMVPQSTVAGATASHATINEKQTYPKRLLEAQRGRAIGARRRGQSGAIGGNRVQSDIFQMVHTPLKLVFWPKQGVQSPVAPQLIIILIGAHPGMRFKAARGMSMHPF